VTTYDVHAFGSSRGTDIRPPIKYYTDLEQALEGVDIVVLPLPCSSDNETVNMPQSKERQLFPELLGKMNKKQIM
jgi:dipicolinate synthase subunit A